MIHQTSNLSKQGAFYAGLFLSWLVKQRPAQSFGCIALGLLSLFTPLELSNNRTVKVLGGFVSVGFFSAGSIAARKWNESEGITLAIVQADRMKMAQQLALDVEASDMFMRKELGLYDDSAQKQLMMLQQQLAQMEQQAMTPAINVAAIPGSPQAPLGDLPVEDLALTIANCPSDESNFIFASKSRSGKTSLIVNIMAHKSAENDWMIYNGKVERDNNWGGLIDCSTAYMAVNSEVRAKAMHRSFLSDLGALQKWQDKGEDHYPLFVVFEELNNQRALLNDKICKDLDKKIRVFATQCMSERSGLWISTHSHNVEDVGLNRKNQVSFQVIVLGREGKYESIEAAIDDQYLIRSKKTRDRLREQLTGYQQRNGQEAIAFTNQGGSNRIVKLPFYDKAVSIKRGYHDGGDDWVGDRENPSQKETPAPIEDAEDTRQQLNSLINNAIKKKLQDQENASEESEPQTEDDEVEEDDAEGDAEGDRQLVSRFAKLRLDQLPDHGSDFVEYVSAKYSDEDDETAASTRQIYQNWGKRRFDSVDEMKRFLARLIGCGVILANSADLSEFLINPLLFDEIE